MIGPVARGHHPTHGGEVTGATVDSEVGQYLGGIVYNDVVLVVRAHTFSAGRHVGLAYGINCGGRVPDAVRAASNLIGVVLPTDTFRIEQGGQAIVMKAGED